MVCLWFMVFKSEESLVVVLMAVVMVVVVVKVGMVGEVVKLVLRFI